ncbi:hypothetical protein K9L97_01050 [Candidatus Woesearchaeota archaeon]|nr:hypothetical protein [Candidatus Woesearchaeota archaeon]
MKFKNIPQKIRQGRYKYFVPTKKKREENERILLEKLNFIYDKNWNPNFGDFLNMEGVWNVFTRPEKEIETLEEKKLILPPSLFLMYTNKKNHTSIKLDYNSQEVSTNETGLPVCIYGNAVDIMNSVTNEILEQKLLSWPPKFINEEKGRNIGKAIGTSAMFGTVIYGLVDYGQELNGTLENPSFIHDYLKEIMPEAKDAITLKDLGLMTLGLAAPLLVLKLGPEYGLYYLGKWADKKRSERIVKIPHVKTSYGKKAFEQMETEAYQVISAKRDMELFNKFGEGMSKDKFAAYKRLVESTNTHIPQNQTELINDIAKFTNTQKTHEFYNQIKKEENK